MPTFNAWSNQGKTVSHQEKYLLQDRDLLQMLFDNDPTAIRNIYDKYWKKLFVFAYKVLKNDPVCEDIIQDIFIQLWENRKTTTISNLESYLFQSVKYQVSNNIRRTKFFQCHDEAMNEAFHSNSTEEFMNLADLTVELKRSIDFLPSKCREIFYLSRYKHLTNREIADRMNISIRTVETQISKALKQIRGQLRSEKVDLIMLLIFFEM